MFRLLGIACFFSVVPLLNARTCVDAEERGAGEPCTRESHCDEPLQCVAGICRAVDAGSSDGSTDS